MFQDIMNRHTRYAVMDDYTLSVNSESSQAGVSLNGDTAVHSLLDYRRTLDQTRNYTQYFDITEDRRASEHSSDKNPGTLTLAKVCLPHSPLPRDLPTVNKDLLILSWLLTRETLTDTLAYSAQRRSVTSPTILLEESTTVPRSQNGGRTNSKPKEGTPEHQHRGLSSKKLSMLASL
jgi:hypothetical protein